ncbi:hypothetical protein [Mucilaginibacter sp. OK283]|jgi:hypothetical protein|uniref:hypothetical protein n=1 Tax=Mucilaginibacter sp. OK283 TaxID=1881049 RepID=UPI0008C336D5|nr:hypothetical protein [Mucilaginibacter sp. OK283]SEO97509.1 hypothetical protein SAMN05428947_105301 [Mucilaginibacter sp. OK283]
MMMKLDHLTFKKGLGFILLCFSTVLVKAQADTVYRHLPDARQRIPLYVINNQIIGSGLNINPNDIEAINVFKGTENIPPQFRNLSKDGILFINLKKGIEIKTRSFKEIKDWLDIKEDVRFAVDGFYVDDMNLAVAVSSICQLDVIKKQQQNKSVPDVINIWTLEPGSRKGFVPPPPVAGKPGVIYIR